MKPDGRPKVRKSTHQSIKRAIRIMRLFSESEPSLSVGEVSQKLELHKSTVSRILGVLHEEGLLDIHPESGKYSPGAGLLTLAGVALGQIDVRAASMASLERLATLSDETVTASVFQNDEVVAVAYLPSSQSLRYVVWIGRRTPLKTTASGKLLLAFSNRIHLKEALPSAQKVEIYQGGFAIEVDQFEDGISAIAAPIFDHQGALKAAVSIAGPSRRLDEAALSGYIRPLQEEAYAISKKLGFVGAYPFSK